MKPKTLRPFWRYFGGKWRAAPRYPSPAHRTVIEPFAGAAGYSLRHYERDVVLVERYPVVAEIWRYLIGASSEEIRRIPYVEHVDALPDWVPQGARWLVGFCMNDAAASPCKQLSAGKKKMRDGAYGRKSVMEGWSAERRERVASQVEHIRHWRVIEGDYTDAPDVKATWYIDPPYERAGIHYVHGSKAIDYPVLGLWCRLRRGQVMVCEASDATWLPFQHFYHQKSFGAAGKVQRSAEALWYRE